MINFYGAHLEPRRPPTPKSAPAPRSYRARPKKKNKLSKEDCDILFLAYDISLPPHIFADEGTNAQRRRLDFASPREQEEHTRQFTNGIREAQREQLTRPITRKPRPFLLPAVSLQGYRTELKEENANASDGERDLLSCPASPDPSSAFRPNYGGFLEPLGDSRAQFTQSTHELKTPENRRTRVGAQSKFDGTYSPGIGVGRVIRKRSITPLF